MRYRVDLYDAFDGWIHTNSYEFDDLEEAKKCCNEKNAELGNTKMDHWGVIDLDKGREIHCGATWD